ncbi:MAG: hypothetical protein DLM57_15635 [Pseudonocardiales bacterium]|nr:MAG: hypothetical protein DLM57_15635 [Pseudonocardiales bacterium]
MRRTPWAGLAWSALRYRGGQAVALFVLSVLAVAACAFGPLYERAVENAQLRLSLDQVPPSARGLTLTGVGVLGTLDVYAPSGRLANFYGAPVNSVEIPVTYAVHGRDLAGVVVSRTAQCGHLPLADGHCPQAPFEVAASVAGARALGWSIGTRITVNAGPAGAARVAHPLSIVGLYGAIDPGDEYWFGNRYSAGGAPQEIHSASVEAYSADALFARDGFQQDLQQALPGSRSPKFVDLSESVRTETDLALRDDRLALQDLGTLRTGLAALIAADQGVNPDVRVQTNINVLLDEVDRGRRQARTVIPAFAAELALLVVVTLGIVVVAAADQRRPELALARLRGYTTSRSAWQVGRELAGLVAAGVLPGVLLAWWACSLVGHWWLSGRGVPQLRWPVLAAAGAVLAAELAIITVVSVRAASRTVQDLLRRVPPRWSRRGVGAAEAGVAAAAIGGVLVVLSGDKNNALAVLTPGLLALLVGLLVSRMLGYSAQVIGRRAVWRGRLGIGLAAVQIARRPGARRVVTSLCVAVALLVSAADGWSVSARNRAVRADVQTGAAVVLSAHADSVVQLRAAVSAADSSGRYATPVVVQQPSNGDPVFAVDPAAWTSIAAWGWPHDRPAAALVAKLTPVLPPPVIVTGGAYRLRLANVTVTRTRAPGSPLTGGALNLLLSLHAHDGQPLSVTVGPLPASGPNTASASVTVSGPLPCSAGCSLNQISLLRSPTDTDMVDVSAEIAELDAGTPGKPRPVDLGAATQWGEASAESASVTGPSQVISMDTAGTSLRITATNSGAPATLQHLDIPLAIPALSAGAIAASTTARGDLSANGIDGSSAAYQPVGAIPLVPGARGAALLVDLDIAAKVATSGLAGSAAQVWLANNNPTREHTLIAALAAHGVTVSGRDSTAQHRRALARSAPAWAMQLALISTLLTALIAALVILITAATSARGRAYDLSALQLSGLRHRVLRRANLIEQLGTITAAVLAGGLTGLLGAHLAFSALPIFLADAAVPAVLRPTPWVTVGIAALSVSIVLALVGVVTVVDLLRRSGPGRLRDSAQ